MLARYEQISPNTNTMQGIDYIYWFEPRRC